MDEITERLKAASEYFYKLFGYLGGVFIFVTAMYADSLEREVKDLKHKIEIMAKEDGRKNRPDMLGNKYGEKNTEESVLALFEELKVVLNTPRPVSVSKREVEELDKETGEMKLTRREKNGIEYKPTSISRALLDIGKTEGWLHAVNERFANNEKVSESYKEIKQIARTNVVEAAEAGIIKDGMAKMILMNNHDWITSNNKSEVTEVDAILKNIDFEDDTE